MPNLIDGTPEGEDLYGTDGQDIIHGHGGNDTITNVSANANGDEYYGDDGDDSFVLNDYSYAFNYKIDGGDGNDTLYASRLDDLLISSVETFVASNSYIGGIAPLAGFTTIRQSDPFSYLTLDLTGAGGMLDLTGKVADDINSDVRAYNLMSGIALKLGNGSDYVNGSNYDDTIHGNGGSDTIFGAGGTNALYGGAGDDHLISDGTGDILDGGDNDDHITLNSGSSLAQVDGGTGTDVLIGGNLLGVTVANVEVLELGLDYYGDLATLGGFSTVRSMYGPYQISFWLSGAGGTADFGAMLGAGYTAYVNTNALTSASNLTLTAGNDFVFGSTYGDTVHAGDGKDTLYINGDHADFHGEGDNDTFIVNFTGATDVKVDGGDGVDVLQAQSLTGITFSNIEIYETPGDYHGDIATLAQFDAIREAANPPRAYIYLEGAGGTLDLSGPLQEGAVSITATSLTSGSDITLTRYHDFILGSAFDDVIHGGGGNDQITDALGHNTIYAGDNDDHVIFGDSATPGSGYVDGGDGNDLLVGNGGAYEVHGGAGDDTVMLFGPIPTTVQHIDGGTGSDTLQVLDLIDYNVSNFEILESNFTSARLDQLSGFTELRNNGWSSSFWMFLQGAGGTFNFASHSAAGTGFTLYANSLTSGVNFTFGTGSDEVYGSVYADTIKAGGGDDNLNGGKGNDSLYGEWGNDRLHGDAGKDYLVGGVGADRVEGGAGGDTFVFRAGDLVHDLGGKNGYGGQFDQITDFTGAGRYVVDEDFIAFTGFGAGTKLEYVRDYGDAKHQIYHLIDPTNDANSGYILVATDTTNHLAKGDYAFY